jgi:hypothetical protein
MKLKTAARSPERGCRAIDEWMNENGDREVTYMKEGWSRSTEVNNISLLHFSLKNQSLGTRDRKYAINRDFSMVWTPIKNPGTSEVVFRLHIRDVYGSNFGELVCFFFRDTETSWKRWFPKWCSSVGSYPSASFPCHTLIERISSSRPTRLALVLQCSLVCRLLIWGHFTCPVQLSLCPQTSSFLIVPHQTCACSCVVSWGTMLQAGRSRVRFPMRSLDFLIDPILPAALWPWSWLSL